MARCPQVHSLVGRAFSDGGDIELDGCQVVVIPEMGGDRDDRPRKNYSGLGQSLGRWVWGNTRTGVSSFWAKGEPEADEQNKRGHVCCDGTKWGRH